MREQLGKNLPRMVSEELPNNIILGPQCSESYPVQAIHNLGEAKHNAQANSEGNRDLIWVMVGV